MNKELYPVEYDHQQNMESLRELLASEGAARKQAEAKCESWRKSFSEQAIEHDELKLKLEAAQAAGLHVTRVIFRLIADVMNKREEDAGADLRVPRELYGWLVEYALELRGAWFWKANSTHLNCETMTKLDNHLKDAIKLRQTP